MRSRRAFLKGVAPIAALSTFPSKTFAVEDLCDHYAKCLAQSMEARHGKRWEIQINHKTGSIFGRPETTLRPLDVS